MPWWWMDSTNPLELILVIKSDLIHWAWFSTNECHVSWMHLSLLNFRFGWNEASSTYLYRPHGRRTQTILTMELHKCNNISSFFNYKFRFWRQCIGHSDASISFELDVYLPDYIYSHYSHHTLQMHYNKYEYIETLSHSA